MYTLSAIRTYYGGLSKPERFGNPEHCSECAEHNQTLLTHDEYRIQKLTTEERHLLADFPQELIDEMPGEIESTLDTDDGLNRMISLSSADDA